MDEKVYNCAGPIGVPKEKFNKNIDVIKPLADAIKNFFNKLQLHWSKKIVPETIVHDHWSERIFLSLSEEAKPKITRSRARHIRRKRLISARRAAENDQSGVTNVESERSYDSRSPENLQVDEALTKSKARRLRKRNKTENEKSLGKSCVNKTDIVVSPSRVNKCLKKTFTEDIIVPSIEPTSETEFSNGKNDIIGLTSIAKVPISSKVTASEHELFENEKNLKITENSRSSVESHIRITDDYECGVITTDASLNFLINESTNSRIIAERETIIHDLQATANRHEESSIICETKISSSNDREGAVTRDDVKSTNLTSETPRVSATNEQIVNKMNTQEKTREQVKAEREAKKAAKAATKSKGKVQKSEIDKNVTSTKSVPEVIDEPVMAAKVVDVVDGEILPMMHKLTTSSAAKKKFDVCELTTSAESKNEGKSKSELRAERRAKQEAQRAVKQSQVPEKPKPKVVNLITEVTSATTTTKKLEEPVKKSVKRLVIKENAHEVNLFKHLYHEREQALISMPTVNSNIHPAIVRLGVQYAEKVIVGSNARCVALLAAVKRLIEDFERPSQADFTRGLEASLQESSAYLHHCRPLAVSMQNALRHLKWQMTQLSTTTSDEEAKTKLGNAIDTYIQEQIHLADKAISITIQTKISNGDVILTYGYSSLINKILCDAHDAGRQFRVVVVDGRPWLEGREQVRRLAKHGLECSYVLINALSFIMPEVSKVFLGAHAILANGAVMSRVGTAQVALMAKSFNVPVLVACETHKTCERVQTDSIVYNEIADPDELVQNRMGSSKRTSLINWRGKKSLNLLNITYDVTPADLVTAVVTELAILPCTSVPVILRIKPSEI